jgi:KDO2-lipid IV(A) lauroyltransferase
MSASADRRRYLLWTTLGSVLERLPVNLAVRLAELAGLLASLPETAPKAAVRSNLRRITGHGTETPIDERVLERWVRRSFASYGRYWAEGATLPAQDADWIMGRISMIEGGEHLDDAMAAGKGCIVALPHIGSWEWGGAYVAQIGYPMTAVAEVLEPPELFDHFVAKRAAIGLRIEPLGPEAGRSIASVLRGGGLVGLLCDRDIEGTGIEVELLDSTARVPAGPATLALRTGATLLAGVIYSGPGEQHSIHLSAPVDTGRRGKMREDVARVSQLVADELSSLIRRAPEQWHVFSDPFASMPLDAEGARSLAVQQAPRAP